MIRFAILALQVVALATFAASPPLTDFCRPFAGKSCVISWEATNQLPSAAKVWRVVPTNFSDNTVSNLLQIAGLTLKDRKHSSQDGVFGGKDVLTYANREDTRHLDIIPSQGTIGLGITGVIAEIPKQLPKGVPDGKEALQLTLNLAEKIGISRAELTTNADGTIRSTLLEGSVLHKDKSSGQIITNITDREIDLSRQIEGIAVLGNVGIAAKFGNENKLSYLSVTWRAIKPDKDCKVPNAAEFVDYLKSGRAWIRNEQSRANYQKITIEKVSLYYWENSGSEPQSYIYPFAVLDAKTDQVGDNANVQLFVPFAEL